MNEILAPNRRRFLPISAALGLSFDERSPVMKSVLTSLAGAAVILATGAAVRAREPQVELKPVESFASIADQKERAVALFKEAGKVIMHARAA